MTETFASPPAFVSGLGGGGFTALEEGLEAVRASLSLDILEDASRTGVASGALILAEDPERIGQWEPGPVTITPSPGPRPLAAQLGALAASLHVNSLVYLSGGSGSLLQPAEVAALAAVPPAAGLITNNLYSSDLLGVRPADAIGLVADARRDNDWAWLLQSRHGLPARELPRTLGTEFDVDSPVDAVLLRASGLAGERARRALESPHFAHPHLDAALTTMRRPASRVLVAGRVSVAAFAEFQSLVPCQTSALIEERGMEASGRSEANGVHSLLGQLLAREHPERFFNLLADCCDVAVLDTRVLLAHLGWRVSRPDRFASDLLWEQPIEHPGLRTLVAAARRAPIPVITGGHSLVSGGLRLLARLVKEHPCR